MKTGRTKFVRKGESAPGIVVSSRKFNPFPHESVEELTDVNVTGVALVGSPANRRPFLNLKSENKNIVSISVKNGKWDEVFIEKLCDKIVETSRSDIDSKIVIEFDKQEGDEGEQPSGTGGLDGAPPEGQPPADETPPSTEEEAPPSTEEEEPSEEELSPQTIPQIREDASGILNQTQTAINGATTEEDMLEKLGLARDSMQALIDSVSTNNEVEEPPAEGDPSTNDGFDEDQQAIADLANEMVSDIDAAQAALN